jgi:hypothetical protein
VIPSPICLLRAIWRSLLTGAAVRGCGMVSMEVHRGCAVYVSRCQTCGGTRITWHHGEPDERAAAGACYCGPNQAVEFAGELKRLENPPSAETAETAETSKATLEQQRAG